MSVYYERETQLYRIEHRDSGLSPFEIDDLDPSILEKGFYSSKLQLPVFDVDIEVLDEVSNLSQVRFAFISLPWYLTTVKDPDFLDQQGFEVVIRTVEPMTILGRQALYLERDVINKETISFKGLNMDYAGLYSCFPTRIIISTQSALECFARKMPGLHRPKEVGQSFLVIAIPYLIQEKEFATVVYEIVDGFYCDDENVRQEIAESSIKYSLDDLSHAFIAMCEVIHRELQEMKAYQFSGMFPYDLDHQGQVHAVDGLVLKRIPFEMFTVLADETEIFETTKQGLK